HEACHFALGGHRGNRLARALPAPGQRRGAARRGSPALTVRNRGFSCHSLCWKQATGKEAHRMDAIEILRQMHVEAKSAFDKIEHASPDERGGLWGKLHSELKLHEQVEERWVYDPVSQEVEGRD